MTWVDCDEEPESEFRMEADSDGDGTPDEGETDTGGDWFSGPQLMRVAGRNKNAPDGQYGDLGFRLVRSAH